MNVLKEVWLEYRPYAVGLTKDFLVAASLWVFFFAFSLLTKLLAVGGWAAKFIEHVHSAGVVVAFVIFAILSTNDIIRTYRTQSKSRGSSSLCFV